MAKLLSDLLTAPEYSLADDHGFIRGQSVSLSTLAPQVASLDLRQLGPDFGVPIFFFGRQDAYCRPSLIWDYSQTIWAPHKEFVWIDASGQFPFFDAPGEFRDELVNRVLPLAAR